MGIQARLIVSLSGVLVLLTLVLGAAFAVREQGGLAVLKRDHLQHSAAIVARLLKPTDATGRMTEVVEGLNALAEPGPRFRIVWEDDHSASPNRIPEVRLLTAERALGPDGRLLVAEELPDPPALLISGIADHLLIGALLTAAAVLAVSFVCQRIVVRPVRLLVAIADAAAGGQPWATREPDLRFRGEIGVLADHLREMSRKIAAAARSARYEAAHLVALRVLRETEEPLRQLRLSMATLEALVTEGSDVEREVRKMGRHLSTLREIARRFDEVPTEP